MSGISSFGPFRNCSDGEYVKALQIFHATTNACVYSEAPMTNEADDKKQRELVVESFADEGDGDDDERRPELHIPPKDRKLSTQPFDFIVGSLEEQISDGQLILQDEYQRRQIWDVKKSSRLIESLLLNVPIPVCYFAELDDGTYSVIDGQHDSLQFGGTLQISFRFRVYAYAQSLTKSVLRN
jgi:hypothetical protein